MASILYGGGVMDIRGSIGGQTHSKNRYGHYIRQKTKPVNPRSPAQQAVRLAMQTVVNAWSSIVTAAQRTAWEVYAASIVMQNALGASITLTGFNHYVRSNVARLNVDLALKNVAPTTLSLPPVDQAFAITASSAAQTISVAFTSNADWNNEDSAKMTIHQALPQLASRAFFNGHFRKIGTIDGSSGSPLSSPQTVAVEFPIAEDQRQWVRGRILRADGRLSEFFRDDELVGA